MNPTALQSKQKEAEEMEWKCVVDANDRQPSAV